METQKHPSHTYLKDGIYYFSRAVPSDIRHCYIKRRIVFSLRTKSAFQAAKASKAFSAKLEDYWLGLRLQQTQIPASHLLKTSDVNLNPDFPSIEEALEFYLEVKGKDRSQLFFTHAKRNVGYLIDCLGVRSVDQYNSSDAATLRNHLQDKGLGSASMLRIFGSIKAIMNFTILEKGLDIKNPFAGVYLPQLNDQKKRPPIPKKQLKIIQSECIKLDDDIRWLVALISDSGMRLSEAAGLLMDDLLLEAPVPYIHVKPYPHRRLKTHSSERKIPLVGASLWAAQRIKENNHSDFCFPRYANTNPSWPLDQSPSRSRICKAPNEFKLTHKKTRTQA